MSTDTRSGTAEARLAELTARLSYRDAEHVQTLRDRALGYARGWQDAEGERDRFHSERFAVDYAIGAADAVLNGTSHAAIWDAWQRWRAFGYAL